MSNDKEKMKNALADLIKFKSITGNRAEIKKVYDYVENLFPKDIFDCEYLENEGVVSQVIHFKGTNWREAKLLLSGHIDVVPANDEEFIPRVEDNKIYGRGSADMKGGVVAMIFAMLRLVEEEKKYDCALILNSDEEIGGYNGVGYLVAKENLRPGFVLCPDGPATNKLTIITKEKGVAWLQLSAEGKSAHASMSYLGKNAVESLFLAWQKICTIVPPSADTWTTSAVMSHIETSNSGYNCVPSDARAVVDLRFTEDFALTLDEVLQKIKKVLPEGVSVKNIAYGEILRTNDNNPQVLKLQEIMNKVCGYDVQIGFSHGASDVRFFGSLGIPAALIGMFGANCHAPGEWANLEALVAMEESIFEFLKVF